MSYVIALGAFLGFIVPHNPVLVLSVLAVLLLAKGIFDVRIQPARSAAAKAAAH